VNEPEVINESVVRDLASLAALEQVIERGRVKFQEVGEALLTIREQRLYRLTYRSWECYCTERWGWTGRRGNQLAAAAKLAHQLGTSFPNERAARQLGSVGTDETKRRHPASKSTPKEEHPESDERFTPGDIIEDAREVMGTIDFDPASCAEANEVVKADVFYTIEDDGLTKEWHGNGWCNWPFSSGNMLPFSEKLLQEVDAKRTKQAVVLTNADTSTTWWQLLARSARSLCLPDKRINFINAPRGNWMSQTLFYFGWRTARFNRVFGARGVVMLSMSIR
jgi:hypothetical protein